MKKRDRSSNSITKPLEYFYKKRKITFINQYGYEQVTGSAWFKGPEPEKETIHIDTTVQRFEVKYPFGQRRTNDVLVKGFRKSVWNCSVCNHYYGKIYKSTVKEVYHKNFHPKYDCIPENSYMYIRCYCEDIRCSYCAKRMGRTPLTTSLHQLEDGRWGLYTQGIMSSGKVIYGGCQECNKNKEKEERDERMIALLYTGEDYEQFPFGEDGNQVDNRRLMDKWGWKFCSQHWKFCE